MKGRIRCTSCPHLDEQNWCTRFVAHVAHPRHWRRCAEYVGRLPISTIRAHLEADGLLEYVTDLRDTSEGRLLRLKLNTPTAERFDIYRTAGLRISVGVRPTIREKDQRPGRRHRATDQHRRAS